MSSIQAYKTHKLEGTLVSKMHGALGTSSYISGCMIIVGYADQYKVTKKLKIYTL